MVVGKVVKGSEEESRSFDPALVEILNNEIGAISEEMALTISRSARSPMVRNGDFATTLTDHDGGIVGQGYAAPQQLAQFMSLMGSLVLKFGDDVHPDDVFLANDPYQGAGHMPDIAIIRPIFWRSEPVGFSVAYSHQNDIGGRFPGGFSSQCGSTYEEGVRLPIVKFVDAGVRNDALLDVITANVRGPEVWLGDVEAKMAGCWRGARELEAVLDRHGREAFETYCWYVKRSSEAAVRAAIAKIPDGSYEIHDAFEDDGFATPGATVALAVRIDVSGDHLTVDFTGTAPQVPSAINMGLSQTKACILGAMKVLVHPDVQMNEGFTRPIDIEVPPGCVVNPVFPAAVGGRGPLASRVRVLVMLALAKALPGRIPVPSEGADSLHAVGRGRDPFVMLDGFFGGWGGRPGQDGIDGVAPMEFGSYGVTSGEMIEREYPVVLEGFGYVPDSAGPGEHRGSLSLERAWRFLEPASVMIRTTRLEPSGGLAGGAPAGRSGNRLHRAAGGVEEGVDRMHWHIDMQPGDRLAHVIGGCGGYGDPWVRQPDRVLVDVLDGTLTADAALEQYGVVVVPDGHGWKVDGEATAEARTGGAVAVRVAFDIGGTFTDIIILRDDGTAVPVKVLSLLDTLGTQLRDLVAARGDGAVEHFVHGTTIASNMVIEAKTAKTALLTTPGFRDILGIRGERRPNIYDPTWERPPALVPRRWSRTVTGRIRSDGTVDEELDLDQAGAVLQELLDDGIEAIAVCLVNSYANPAHEEALGALIEARAPGLPVCLSSRLNPEIGEYERASTTAINASLVPGIRRYLDSLSDGLHGLTDRLVVMRSNGGVMSGALAREYPVNMIESGPAAGALAAGRLARETGLHEALAFDMGGTTAKACLVQDGVPLEKPGGEIGPGLTAATRLFGGGGYAVRVPSLDIVEVGAGGGSIAWIDGGGALRVGPRSAGADPGPACYGQGGTEPTVTDANLVLGYLNPHSIAGASLSLDADAAVRAVHDVIAAPLGLDLRQAALGICEVANSTMMRALRAVTTERGRDPRSCSLVAFGGAGAMHAARLASFLGITEIHVPVHSGVFSAIGLLFADFRTDYVRSIARILDGLPAEVVATALGEMEDQAAADMGRQGVATDGILLERHAELRARGQTAELAVEVPADLDAAGILDRLPALFAKQHLEAFGHVATGQIEFLSLRVRARVRLAGTTFADLAGVERTAGPAIGGERVAFFGAHGGERRVPVTDRWSITGTVEGPLIVEEPDTTVVVPPGWSAHLNDLGSIVMTHQPK